MHESSKACRRRWCEDYQNALPFKWRDIFQGRILDVGCSTDKLPFDDCIGFDCEEGADVKGDANKLSDYFEEESFRVVHGSQVAEHLQNPKEAILDWLTLIETGGYLCLSVPEAVLYGDMFWDEKRFNADHKSTWSMWIKDSAAPIHIYIPEFVNEIESETGAECLLARVVDTNYNYKKLLSREDQTFDTLQMIEAFDEILLQKAK